jgi:hypothetical protein
MTPNDDDADAGASGIASDRGPVARKPETTIGHSKVLAEPPAAPRARPAPTRDVPRASSTEVGRMPASSEARRMPAAMMRRPNMRMPIGVAVCMPVCVAVRMMAVPVMAPMRRGWRNHQGGEHAERQCQFLLHHHSRVTTANTAALHNAGRLVGQSGEKMTYVGRCAEVLCGGEKAYISRARIELMAAVMRNHLA